MSFIGASGSSAVLNNGRIFIAAQAARSAAARRAGDRATCGPSWRPCPGIRVYPQILPTIRIGGQLTKAVYQYTLQDADTQELYQWAPAPVRPTSPAARGCRT